MPEHEQAGGDEVEGEEDAGADDGVERLERQDEGRDHAHSAAHLIGRAGEEKKKRKKRGKADILMSCD